MGYYKGGQFWSDEQLESLTKNHAPVEVNVRTLLKATCIPCWNMSNLLDLTKEIETIIHVPLDKPIILIDGRVADGCHRLVRAYLEGSQKIQAFELNSSQLPEPYYDETEACKEQEANTAF
jgi:hypothetical protein